jgi:hypothetical protein
MNPHLHEAQDYHKIADPSLKWLAQYTYENLNKWPHSDIIQDLLHRFPSNAGTIYRGINFNTPEQYAEFMQPFAGSQTAELTFTGVTSWSTHKQTAHQFAITQPTYFLNREVMMAHDQMQKQRERLSGYRGIILSIRIAQGTGIDVDASGVGHESEVILPPGTYQVHVHEHILTYADQLHQAITTPDQVIQRVKSVSELHRRHDTHSFVDHVLHHHMHDLSDASRNHMFKLLKPRAGEPVFKYVVEPHVRWGDTTDGVDVHYATPALSLFDYYNQGLFVSATHVNAIRKLAREVWHQMVPMLKVHLVHAERLDMGMIRMVAQIARTETELNQILRDTVGAEYHRLQQVGREINQIPDAQARARAIQDHTQALTDLLRKIK